jgi:tellurite resistance protein
MKGRQIERLARKHLLPVLPEFAGRGSLVYRRPVGHLLYALSFDTSSFTSSRIFVEAFVQPLFVPVDCLWFTFGDRLGETRRDEWWDVDEENPDPTFAAIAEVVRRDALPFFSQLDGLDGFCDVIPRWASASRKKLKSLQSMDDPVVLEALGYAELLRGRKDEALQLLNAAVDSEHEDGEYGNAERLANLQHTLDLVQRLGLEAGQAQLAEWRAQTIRNLKIEAPA